MLLLASVKLVAAQTNNDKFIGIVKVESAFTRVLPALDAEPIASVFRDQRLEAVSRNLDGTWFEVRRPGRMNNLGWIFQEVLDWDFKPELLPLGDLTTGVIGPEPLTNAPLYGVFLLEGPILRERPSRRSYRLTDVPQSVTVPVLERNQDGTWLHVNYLGYDGWILSVAGRDLPNVLDIPLGAGLPPLETVPVIIIPVELQQAQIDRLREFIYSRHAYAAEMEQFWWRVFRGEVMPCDAPDALIYYPYTEADVRELPELQRYAPRIATAIDLLTTAREPLLTCGIVSPDIVQDTRDSAINARIIFEASLETLADLEKNVVQARRPRRRE